MAGLIMLRAKAMDLTQQNSQAQRLWEAAPRGTPAGRAQQAEQGGVTLRRVCYSMVPQKLVA